MIIRQETKKDYREVEELIKKAFWNVNMPGCNEHYLAHKLRGHNDFIPELDLVIEEDGKLIGNVMYTRCKLEDDNGHTKNILSFGPLSVLPGYQRKGYGKKLLEYSFEKALEMGYDAIVIFGNPENYICNGFKSCYRYNISVGDGVYPVAMLARELKPGAIEKGNWKYIESPAYDIDYSDFADFDRDFEQMEEAYADSQELFYIYSQSRIIKK